MNVHLKELINDPYVASLAPTRSHNVERILERISDLNVKTFVELGPGDGAFTRVLLERLPASAKLIVVETNPHFVRILKRTLSDSRLEIVEECATHLRKILTEKNTCSVDCIRSGIPLSILGEVVTGRLLGDCHLSLRSGGKLLLYQSLFPGNRKLLKAKLVKLFNEVDEERLPFNFPPLFALFGTKQVSQRVPTPIPSHR